MIRRSLLGLGLLALAACATVTSPPGIPREALRDFAFDGRFALRSTSPGQSPQSTSGRLSWAHQQDADHLLLASPLGIGIAEITSSVDGARLKTGDGQNWEAAQPDELMERVTGQALPISRLPAWLLGRPGQEGKTTHDQDGRPVQLIEAGWQIDYSYDSDAADALPSRITLRRGDELELRLRIEEWRNTP